MYKKKIYQLLKKAISELNLETTDIVVSIPKNPDFGDYTTNIALQLSKQKDKTPQQSPVKTANEILEKIQILDLTRDAFLEKVEVAGNGFINFFIKPQALLQNLHSVCDYSSLVNPEPEAESQNPQKIFMEYGQPNTHKPFHLGHTRGLILGESVSRLFEALGNKVFRSTYGSDIGLPVAKAIWGIQKIDQEENGILLNLVDLKQKVEFLGRAYVKGAKAYEEDSSYKAEIDSLNKRIYLKDPEIIALWEQTRKWSLDYFDSIYKKLGTKFDRAFVESEVAEDGKQMVMDNLGKVFKEDQGAIIFEGENYGLHNRVFVTSAGNPAYEAKDLRLAQLKWEIWPFDKAIIQTGSEQIEYFKVMFKALELIDDRFKDKMSNLPYGMVNLTSGKMSSRTGEVVTFDWLYNEVREKVEEAVDKARRELSSEEKEQIIEAVTMGAIKFSMLKFAPSTNITFDIEKSVSLEGDSGPYVQYSYARAKSVLRNAQFNYIVDMPHSESHPKTVEPPLEVEERLILQKIEHFHNFLDEAASNLHPNIIASYLLELASLFNLFYQKHPILKGERTEFRLALTCAVAIILKQGLYLLGIEAPERM